MSIKLDNPLTLQVARPVDVSVVDVKVKRFIVERPVLPTDQPLTVAVDWIFTAVENGETIPLKTDNIRVQGGAAQGFLNTVVNGKLGVVTEQAILNALQNAGKIPAGVIIDD